MFQVINAFILCELKCSSFMANLLSSGRMEDSSNASCHVLIFLFLAPWSLLFQKKLDKGALGNSQMLFFFFLSETQITTFFFIFYFFLQHRTVNYSHPTCSESFFSTTPSFYKLRKTDFLVEVQNNRKTFSGIHNVGWSKQSDVGLGPHCK